MPDEDAFTIETVRQLARQAFCSFVPTRVGGIADKQLMPGPVERMQVECDRLLTCRLGINEHLIERQSLPHQLLKVDSR